LDSNVGAVENVGQSFPESSKCMGKRVVEVARRQSLAVVSNRAPRAAQNFSDYLFSELVDRL